MTCENTLVITYPESAFWLSFKFYINLLPSPLRLPITHENQKTKHLQLAICPRWPSDRTKDGDSFQRGLVSVSISFFLFKQCFGSPNANLVPLMGRLPKQPMFITLLLSFDHGVTRKLVFINSFMTEVPFI